MPDKILQYLTQGTEIPEEEQNFQAGEHLHSMLSDYFAGLGKSSLVAFNGDLRGTMIISKDRIRKELGCVQV